jgi:hypothetical protein
LIFFNKTGLFWALLFVNGLIYEQSDEALFQLQVSYHGWAVAGIKFLSPLLAFSDRAAALDDCRKVPAQWADWH